MEITRHVREFAEAQGLDAEEAVEAGLAKKSEGFRDGGAEIYS